MTGEINWLLELFYITELNRVNEWKHRVVELMLSYFVRFILEETHIDKTSLIYWKNTNRHHTDYTLIIEKDTYIINSGVGINTFHNFKFHICLWSSG